MTGVEGITTAAAILGARATSLAEVTSGVLQTAAVKVMVEVDGIPEEMQTSLGERRWTSSQLLALFSVFSLQVSTLAKWIGI